MIKENPNIVNVKILLLLDELKLNSKLHVEQTIAEKKNQLKWNTLLNLIDTIVFDVNNWEFNHTEHKHTFKYRHNMLYIHQFKSKYHILRQLDKLQNWFTQGD